MSVGYSPAFVIKSWWFTAVSRTFYSTRDSNPWSPNFESGGLIHLTTALVSSWWRSFDIINNSKTYTELFISCVIMYVTHVNKTNQSCLTSHAFIMCTSSYVHRTNSCESQPHKGHSPHLQHQLQSASRNTFSYISFSSFTFSCAPYRIFLLFFPGFLAILIMLSSNNIIYNAT